MFAKTIIAALALASSASALQINTPPSITVCVPVAITWSANTGSTFLTIIPGGQPAAAPLINFGEVTGNTLAWTANLTAGTSITLAIVDGGGVPQYSSPITIQAGTSTSCLAVSGAGVSSGVSSAVVAGSSTSAAVVASSSSAAAVSSSAAVVASSSTASRVALSSSTAAAAAATTSAAASSTRAATSAASSAVAQTTSSGATKTTISGLAALLLGAVGIVMV